MEGAAKRLPAIRLKITEKTRKTLEVPRETALYTRSPARTRTVWSLADPSGGSPMNNAAARRSNLLVPEIREVMDIRQASDYLGISPDTLYKYASEGFVPAFKLGNRWRFKRSRLDEWMDQQSGMNVSGTIDPEMKKPVKAAL
jgi:excisionase family DNA binding protein